MKIKPTLSRCTPRHLETLAHVSSWVAVVLTAIMVTAIVAEPNPVAAAIMDYVGMAGFALLAPILISVLYRLVGRYGDRLTRSYATRCRSARKRTDFNV